MRIKHLLLTKFNCDLILENKVLQAKGTSKKLDDRWLKYRWNLFKTFTIPSICAQTYTDFDWLILFDKHSPKWLREESEKIEVPCRKHLSFFDFGSDEFFTAFSDLNDSSTYDICLTTIIDSDDAFHRCAMQRIRDYFLAYPNDYDCLNFEIGYQYNLSTHRLAIVQVNSPPFSTKINRANSKNHFRNSIFFYGGDHSKMPQKYRYREISHGDPMFIQVIHGDNIANRIQWNAVFLHRSLSRRILREAFNINIPEGKISIHYYMSDIKHYFRQIRNNISLQLKHRRDDLI